jgi:4-hydroxybenzoate polyprenyltransferase
VCRCLRRCWPLAAGLLSVGSARVVAILALMPFMALVPSLQEGCLLPFVLPRHLNCLYSNERL